MTTVIGKGSAGIRSPANNTNKLTASRPNTLP